MTRRNIRYADQEIRDGLYGALRTGGFFAARHRDCRPGSASGDCGDDGDLRTGGNPRCCSGSARSLSSGARRGRSRR